MAKEIILYIGVSIDGYIADEHGQVDFLTLDVEPTEIDNSYENLLAQIDTVVMGRSTYDQVITELSPEVYPYEEQQTYVITSRSGEEKENITFTSESPTVLLRRLKKESGKNIWIVGGGQVIAPLIEENLIDRYIIAVVPKVLGKGVQLVPFMNHGVELEMIEAYTKNGMVYIEYKKK